MVTITNSKPTKSGTLPNIINEKNYMNYKVMLAKILSEKELADMDSLSGHAQAWMPAFAERLAAEARHPFYRAAAAYLGALVG